MRPSTGIGLITRQRGCSVPCSAPLESDIATSGAHLSRAGGTRTGCHKTDAERSHLRAAVNHAPLILQTYR